MSNIDLNQIFITNNTQGIGDTVVISSGYPATNSVGPSRFSLTSLGGVLSGPLLIDDGPSTHFRVVLNELQRKYFKRMEHCSFDFYTFFLFQTCFIVDVTFSSILKHPNKSFFNPINIFLTSFTHTLLLFFLIYIFRLNKNRCQ